MFDCQQAEILKAQLPELDLSRPLIVASLPVPEMHSYLEFYGFFETLKNFNLDYFWGMRQCACGAGQRRVATHFWRLLDSRGTIFLLHGLFDHVGLFQKITAYFLAQGYSVVSLDLPGHGLSEGGATQIESFSDYGDVVTDTMMYFQQQTARQPLYAVGQSTGAAVLMNLSFDRQRQSLPPLFERMAFLGPLVRPRRWLIGRLAYRLIGRYLSHVQRDLSSPNSHDAEFHNFLRYYDCLQPRKLCITWIGALHQWVNKFAQQPVVDVPILIVQGTADNVVDWGYNVGAIQKHFPHHQLNYVEGAMHHLANEADPWRQAIYNGIGQFFRQRRGADLGAG